MKRVILLLLIFIISNMLCLQAEAKELEDKYILPEGMKTVPLSASDFSLPEGLPGTDMISAFSIEDGMIHLELKEKVPKLKIFEKDQTKGTESTIFSKKNTKAANAHIVGKGDTSFVIRIYWTLDKAELVQEYRVLSDYINFSGYVVEETMEASEFGQYSFANRKLLFDGGKRLTSETYTLENEETRFIRLLNYNPIGELISTEVCWESLKTKDNLFNVVMNSDGMVTTLKYKNKKSTFIAASQRAKENLNTPDSPLNQCPDPFALEEQLAIKYPQLIDGTLFSNIEQEVGLIDGENIINDDRVVEIVEKENTDDTSDPLTILDLSISEKKLEIATETDLMPTKIAESVPATVTDLIPATTTDLIPATTTDLIPATTTDLIPATTTDLFPATVTDLYPATLTDLEPATTTDLIPTPKAEIKPSIMINSLPESITDQSSESISNFEVNSKDESELVNKEVSIKKDSNAYSENDIRVWSLSLSIDQNTIVYAFITDDPLFIQINDSFILNDKAADINGNLLAVDKSIKKIVFPNFDLPNMQK